MPNQMPKVLLCGFQSFAAQGLAQQLHESGCVVDGFARRKTTPISGLRQQVSGHICNLSENVEFDESYDIVVNYLLLKNESIEENKQYLKQLLDFCVLKRVKHLIHISSVSVYPGSLVDIDESSPIETEPNAKGAYGALKVASDNFLLQNVPEAICLSLVRPGFILGEGLVDPIVGMALRTPFNRLFVIGNRKNVVPITTREILNRAISELVRKEPTKAASKQPYILVSPNSPDRLTYLRHLSAEAGYGKSPIWFPNPLWHAAAASAGLAELIFRIKRSIRKPIANATRIQRFATNATSASLKMNLEVDWRKEVISSIEGQEKNYAIPNIDKSSKTSPLPIGYVGWGRIVKRLGLNSRIIAYDLVERTDESGQKIERIGDSPLAPASLYVVATPGPQHHKAIDQLSHLDCPILVEKPLAYDETQLNAWLAFSKRHIAPVSVCHNYRFKSNVLEMWDFLSRYNAGLIKHVDVWFQSPPVANESTPWLRDERQSRTLLYDYSIHFLDLACQLNHGNWELDNVRAEKNQRGETSLIQGLASSSTYSVAFLLRQGAMPRRAKIRFVFQNYDVALDFFPETFYASMSPASPSLLRRKATVLAKATRQKVFEKLTGQDSDRSHDHAISCSLSGSITPLRIEELSSFYRLLFKLGDRVYS
jgi:nucleoside-diphosphate-sugar epimerase